MIPRRFFRDLFVVSRTIELIAEDRLALGRQICKLRDAERAHLQWSDKATQQLYNRLMARNPRGYDGWHPNGVQLVPITLSKAQWTMVDQLCAELTSEIRDSWPTRVLTEVQNKMR